VLLAVSINGSSADIGAMFLQDKAGHLFAPASFLTDWNLRPGGAPFAAADGSLHFDLSRIRGLTYKLIEATAELQISAAADAFLPNRINIGSAAGGKVAPYTPGGYLNYDVSVTRSPARSTAQGLLDVAVFRGEGLFTSSFTTGTAANARLMTAWQTDRIDKIKTLRVGDSFNHTGTWGRGVLFGGVQYGTNFAIRPDFITSAMPSISGKALLPSTVDVYVNNALRTRQQVSAGPFLLQNLPLITGKGEVELVVTDLLGREQIISQPFFASPTLLREGVYDESYEIGRLRENYGIKSNDYSDSFATATYRRGINGRLTAEGRLEVQKDLAAGGASVALALPEASSVVESSVALSRANGLASGTMASAVYSYFGRRWSANARLQLNSTDFRQLGSDPLHLPRQIGAVQASAPVGRGTFAVNYLRRMNQGEPMTRLVNISYSQPLAESVFASFTLLKPLSGTGGTTAALTISVMFDTKHVGSSTLSSQTGGATLYTDFQQATPRSEGYGYRLASLNGGSNERQEASVTRNASYASFQAEVVQVKHDVSTRLNAAGGVAALGGDVYFSRGLNEGFAIVDTAGFAGVPVSLENQEVARTNAAGRAVVVNLHPYQPNHIGIDPLKLPVEASVNEIEKIVVPRSRGGVIVDFAVRRIRSATLTIVQADGEPLPPWTTVEIVGSEQTFVSGKRGEVFVDLPAAQGNRVIARPDNGPVCEFVVDLPAGGDPSPFLPPSHCGRAQ
jgi:outer membrane usher protein